MRIEKEMQNCLMEQGLSSQNKIHKKLDGPEDMKTITMDDQNRDIEN